MIDYIITVLLVRHREALAPLSEAEIEQEIDAALALGAGLIHEAQEPVREKPRLRIVK